MNNKIKLFMFMTDASKAVLNGRSVEEDLKSGYFCYKAKVCRGNFGKNINSFEL